MPTNAAAIASKGFGGYTPYHASKGAHSGPQGQTAPASQPSRVQKQKTEVAQCAASGIDTFSSVPLWLLYRRSVRTSSAEQKSTTADELRLRAVRRADEARRRRGPVGPRSLDEESAACADISHSRAALRRSQPAVQDLSALAPPAVVILSRVRCVRKAESRADRSARLSGSHIHFYIPSTGEVCCSCSIRSSML